MIQRIQSLYLLISAALVALMYFMPYASITGYSDEILLNSRGIFKSSGEMVEGSALFLIAIGIEVLFTLAIIFQFKKRNRQMLLAKFNLLLMTIIIAVVFFYADYAKALTGLPKDSIVNYEVTCLLPVISIVLNYLAIRAIKKDEDLVRAADRLR